MLREDLQTVETKLIDRNCLLVWRVEWEEDGGLRKRPAYYNFTHI
jgi:hypothetical protein